MRPIAILALATLANAAAADDGRQKWPRAIEVEQGTLVVYQPQLEKFEGVTLSGRSAVSWQAKGGAPAPVFGVFWFDARVLVDKDSRALQVEQLTVTKVRFPNITPEKERSVAKLIEAEVPRWDVHGNLDEVQASIAVTQKEKKSEKGISVAPPKLVFSYEPAVLLLYDGPPAIRPLPETKLERVVNTPLFVVRDPETKRFYLGGGKFWYEATDPKGPWSPNATPSPAVKAVYDKNPPPPPPAPEAAADGSVTPATAKPAEPDAPPRIVVATEPTELLVFDGKPSYAPVGSDANLLYADNSDGRVMVHVPTSETFVLVSGRWYKAASLAGPWTAVRPDQLPAPFRKIPPDSPVGDVRAFVTGTDEANDAVADAQIPQTTAVKRDQSVQVTYDGDPKFKAIEGTTMSYAVNTSFSVIQDGGKFWCCHQGAWYVADGPKGPWKVSDKRPPSIDQVPPSAPVYNTKYVYVYQSTPEVVYVGYLPGYTGVYPYYGTVVYGTGYAYAPYIGPTVYYPPPATFGVHVAYSPYGGWGVGVSYGTPFFSVGIHFGGAPYHGYYGPRGYYPPRPPYYGYRAPPPGYRPPAGRYPGGGYGSRYGSPTAYGGAVARNPSQLPANNNLYNRPENANRNAARTSTSDRRAPSASQQPNNVYGDRNGDVYRQNQNGGWDRNTSSGWQGANGGAGASARQQPAGGGASAAGSGGARAAQTPASTGSAAGAGGSAQAGLNRDAAARSRSSGYGGGGGGYGGGGGRAGGGGSRGGGRR
jgi:hypothetical protein